jgi:hypothetical protein
MMGPVKAPDLFRAGATFAGVSDLLMLVDDDSWADAGGKARGALPA